VKTYTAAKQQPKPEWVKKVCAKGFQSIVRRTEATGSQRNKNSSSDSASFGLALP